MTGTFSGTMRVRTTLVPELQDLAEQVIGNALEENERRDVSQGALIAMRPDGAVLAMVGGRNYKESQFNRAVQAERQAGSAFKLFVYMAALRSGMTLNDTIDDAPLDIDGWRPENFGGRHYGTVTLADAFARSINTASVRLALKVGMGQVIAAARDLGINAPLPNVPSLALGSAEVKSAQPDRGLRGSPRGAVAGAAMGRHVVRLAEPAAALVHRPAGRTPAASGCSARATDCVAQTSDRAGYCPGGGNRRLCRGQDGNNSEPSRRLVCRLQRVFGRRHMGRK